MKVPLQITILGADGSEAEQYVINAYSPDVRKWEEEHGESWYESKTTLRQSNELAYNALTRVGKFTGTFEQFERVADVDTVEQSSADPTPTAPGEEASSG